MNTEDRLALATERLNRARTELALAHDEYKRVLRQTLEPRPTSPQSTEKLLADLRDAAEATNEDRHGHPWGVVYLPNAQGSRTRQQFGGLLRALKDAGYYRPTDDLFGEVLLAE